MLINLNGTIRPRENSKLKNKKKQKAWSSTNLVQFPSADISSNSNSGINLFETYEPPTHPLLKKRRQFFKIRLLLTPPSSASQQKALNPQPKASCILRGSLNFH
jgi:hypothetical protein